MYTGLQGVLPQSEHAYVNEREIRYEALQRAGQVMDYDYVNPSRDMQLVSYKFKKLIVFYFFSSRRKIHEICSYPITNSLRSYSYIMYSFLS